MDLRKYKNKYLDCQQVIKYEYEYYSKPSGNNSDHKLVNIIIHQGKRTPDEPGYSLAIHLDNENESITSFNRLIDVYRSGSLIKKFPLEVELEAEKILKDIVSQKKTPSCDLSVLIERNK